MPKLDADNWMPGEPNLENTLDAWNPDQYELFRQQRNQPGRDLVALVQPVPGGRAIDLGCGTGELTEQLHQHAQASETLGIDTSQRMLDAAQQRAAGGLRFEQANILELPAEPGWDVIFSNAALQWLPDHPALVAFLTQRLRPGGQLAIQVPSMEDHPAHVAAKQVARQPRFAAALQGFEHQLDVLTANEYAHLLYDLGYAEQNVRLQIYPHVLPGPEGTVDWIKGTLLTAYQQRLTAAEYDDYLAEYSRRLLSQLPTTRPYFYPYQRILLWGRRA